LPPRYHPSRVLGQIITYPPYPPIQETLYRRVSPLCVRAISGSCQDHLLSRRPENTAARSRNPVPTARMRYAPGMAYNGKTSIWLPEDLRAQVDAICSGSSLSRSDIMRRGAEAHRLEEAAARLEKVVQRLEDLTL
jgi:hypothetical protein